MRKKIIVICSFFLAYWLVLRPRLLTWGAEENEINHEFDSDRLIKESNLKTTRAITINAAPNQIWPWLAQMGRERTGFYGIDRLDNWNIPSISYLRDDVPQLEIGMSLDNRLKVLDFSPNEYLVIGNFELSNDLGGYSDFIYRYQLNSIGQNQTRLMIRMHVFSEGLSGMIYNTIYEVMDYWMTTTQLKGIKERVESSVKPPETITIPLEQNNLAASPLTNENVV